jgi:hypothetical protein
MKPTSPTRRPDADGPGRAAPGPLRFCLRLPGVCCLLLGWLGAAGCGAPAGAPVPKDDPARESLEHIGDAYGRATFGLNRPPANLKELQPYLKEQGDPAKLLRSPNDGEDFVIVWGVELRQLKARGNDVPIVAFEKTGKGGQRYVLRGRSDVVLMTDVQLKAATFPPGYSPPI